MNTRKKNLTLLVILAVLGCGIGMLVLAGCNRQSQQSAIPTKETLYQRVLRTKTIRCSYCAYPPYCLKDPNTGHMTGITSVRLTGRPFRETH
jgi:hypothetical protein